MGLKSVTRRDFLAGASALGAASLCGVPQAAFRITSYNVCYTKLLRNGFERMSGFEGIDGFERTDCLR